MTAEPRWATPRTPDRPSLGRAAWKASWLIKQPLMDWQRRVLDVAMEVLPDGRFAYRNVILTIPRQNGKTTALLAMVVARALLEADTRMVYCAQSALDAKKKWREDWVPALEDSPLKSLVKIRWAPGDEGMVFFNRSRMAIVASKKDSGHGTTGLDIAIVDEAFAYKDARLEQALRPAMMVEPNAQLWIVSTAGTPLDSPYLWDKVKGGRKFVEEGRTRGTCYFEWSAPDDANPADPATWRACMPALGSTITEETIAEDYESLAKEGKLSEFQRAYLNRWVTSLGDPIVSLEHWGSLARVDAPRPESVVLGVEIAPKDSSAAIVAAGEATVSLADGSEAGGVQCTVLDHGEGAAWLLTALGRRCEQYGRPFVVVRDRSCAHLLPELERVVGFDRLRVLKPGDGMKACAFWLRMVQQGRATHRGESELTAALAGAGQRTLDDGWAWSYAKSGAVIAPLWAMTIAVDYWRGAYMEGDNA